MDTGCKMQPFEIHDNIMAWRGNDFHLAIIREYDEMSGNFTVEFYDDQSELENFPPNLMKHLQ